jgi:2-amino-4-hydroxy-6-hydroxymethyldihydropteridine diphosphokinase
MLPPSPNSAFLLLGANLGQRAETMAAARARIAATIGEVLAVSALYETAPWGGVVVEGQPLYLNQALEVRTLLDPFGLLRRCLQIETELGRERNEAWQARTLDIDLLLFGRLEMEFGDELILPHPRMAARRFVLEPLAEIAPTVIVPGRPRLTVAELLAQCPDPLAVQRLPG